MKPVQDRDYYFENGFLVFTEYYLKSRGYCCGNGCRHCPYKSESDSERLTHGEVKSADTFFTKANIESDVQVFFTNEQSS